MANNPIIRYILRSVTKRPLINSINFLGLTISISVVLLLSAYCLRQLNANKFHEHVDNTYIICMKQGSLDNKIGTYTGALLKEQIELSIPEVKNVVRIGNPWDEITLRAGQNPPITSNIIFADPTFIDVFSYKCISGNFLYALKTPMSIVLTRRESLKLFGNMSPIGETVKINNIHFLTVQAIIDEPQGTSSLSFKAIIPMVSKTAISGNGDEFTNWHYGNFTNFIVLNNTNKVESIEKKILALYPEDMMQNQHILLEPFKSLYFSEVKQHATYLRYGNKSTVMVLGLVAILILLMGIVNYVNLSFSMTIEKMKNTGIMKVIGAGKIQILKNNIFESILFFLISLIMAYGVSLITFPFLRNMIGVDFNPTIIFSPIFLLSAILISLTIAILSTLLPALRISSINPINSLKKSFFGSKNKSRYRGVLVVAQFAIAIILIAFTGILQKQVLFGSTQLGYNNENILTVELTSQLNKDVLRKKMMDTPGIKGVSFTAYLPGKMIEHTGASIKYNGEEKMCEFHVLRSDNYFPELLGLQLKQGRFFSVDKSTDIDKVIINEAFVKEYGLENPLGVRIPVMWSSNEMEVIGVVKDFHFQPVHYPITPAAIRYNNYSKYCFIKISALDFNGLHNIVGQIDKTCEELSPDFPVQFDFLDASVEQMYEAELKFRKIFSFFSGIAILICCLGIFGLSIFASQRKIKEIGIRRVNGAKVSEILTMLNKDFIKWVAIAFIVACPIAYYVMSKWLENFAYRTSISWWIFALAGVLAFGIALLTVSYHSYKAASRNPIESLRYE